MYQCFMLCSVLLTTSIVTTTHTEYVHIADKFSPVSYVDVVIKDFPYTCFVVTKVLSIIWINVLYVSKQIQKNHKD